jgi:carbonic anhydrase/acetyltransferase-like protein (isoleucine patch superfamily)
VGAFALGHFPRSRAQVGPVDVKAILLVGSPRAGIQDAGTAPEFLAPESLAQVPLATFDVLGRSPVLRIADHLLAGGVSSVAILNDGDCRYPPNFRQDAARSGIRVTSAERAAFWRECEAMFQEATDAGAEQVIVWRVGAYAELGLDDLIQFHLDQRARVTQVCAPDGTSLEIFVISASRRNDAAFLFRHMLRESRMPCTGYTVRGYCNRLRNPVALRQLAVDALQLGNAIKPVGREIRPGVWLGPEARVQRGARILAPAYIGAYSRVRPATVVTRCSAIENHCEIDFGTVVENSTVLPFTYVGAGLDVCHSVVGENHLLPLRRGVEIEVTDPRLIGSVSEYAGVRTMISMGALLTFLPKQIYRGLFAKSHREQPPSLPEAVNAPSAALREAPTLQPSPDSHQFPSNMVVARRYGNE